MPEVSDVQWLVWCPLSGPPRYRHTSEESARKEAARLASVHKGSEFIVLRTVATYQDHGIQISEHLTHPPF